MDQKLAQQIGEGRPLLGGQRFEEPALALTTEVARWAAAIGVTRLHARVAAFLAGARPLAEPEPD